jgi:hypothetical protein
MTVRRKAATITSKREVYEHHTATRARKAISQAIESGVYQSPDQVIERAFGQFERGEFFSSMDSRTDMEKRKAAWLVEHTH